MGKRKVPLRALEASKALFENVQEGVRFKIPDSLKETIANLKDGDTLHVPRRFLDPENKNIRDKIDTEGDDFEALKLSINRVGLIHYPTVILDRNYLVVLTGHRRLAACEKLGWEEIPVTIKTKISEKDELEYQLFENNNRKNLEPIEYCEALRRYSIEQNLKTHEVAKFLGRDRKFAEHCIKIADWPLVAKNAAREAEVPMTVLREIAKDATLNADLHISENVEKLVASIRRYRRTTTAPKKTETFKLDAETRVNWKNAIAAQEIEPRSELGRDFMRMAKILFAMKATHRKKFKSFMNVLEKA